MKCDRSAFSLPFLLLAFVGAAVWPAGALSGQEIPRVDEERLEVYAAAHADIRRILDDTHVELARAANKIDEAQEEIRRRMRERILAVYEAHGIPEEEYEAITFVLSVDEAQQEVFREIQARLATGDGAGGVH
jgi:hypothetical protein